MAASAHGVVANAGVLRLQAGAHAAPMRKLR